MSVHKTVCNGKATIDVTVNNYGGSTAMGTLKAYVDGNAGDGVAIEVDPYHPTTFTVEAPAGPGEHTVKVVLTYPGGSDSMSKTATLLKDSDCDYLSDREEYEYGTDPLNKDTDGDGIIDSRDMNPVGDYRITIYILRARALDDVDSSITGHNPADMSLDVTVNGQTKTLRLTDNQDDLERKIPAGADPLFNLEDYAIAKATFDVPDDRVFVPITFHLYDRDNDDGTKRTEMDVSPGPDTVARIMYNLKTGTWSGDDYPGDAEKYFGYGHLSGCGDGSCGVSSHDPDKDLKVYVKYESILQKKGIDGRILKVYSPANVSEVRLKSGKDTMIIRKPESVHVAEVLLSNGSVVNVTLVNTYNARIFDLKPIKPPVNPDVPLARKNLSSVEVIATTPEEPLKGEVEIIPLEGGLIDPGLGDVVTYSSQEEHDGEIWFVIVPDDSDGIPFWREVELNKELEANGFSERFDPGDGYMIRSYYPELAESLNEMDELGDYDGDGVPNAVEVLIGKDPAKRDILGIQLNVSVEWKMSDEDKEKLVYSIRKASDFIYDYTDGYAMITRITVWDDKRNWDKADVRVHDTTWVIPQTGFEIFYQGWPKSAIGGYWTGGNVMMPERYQGGPGNGGSIGDVSWGRTLGHELGHYVFWLGDEYMDWHGHSYQLWYYGTLEAAATDSTIIAGGVLSALDLTYYAYKIQFGDFMNIHSVMNKQWKWSELSTPRDYEKFKKDASELWDKTDIVWKLLGYNSPDDMLTDQWGNVTKNSTTDYGIWHCSAWEAVYSFITDHNTPTWIVNKFNNPKTPPRRQRIVISASLAIDKWFKPKTGPYTGVGYFMEVTWE
ncbi:conserved hypothetical protein [Thermococcus sp. AM4]|nr:conserved hypothetical protein [Thermococcus sp. AM4]